MADKKITALTAAASAASDDLLHVVADPGNIPVNKKLTVKNFVGGLTHHIDVNDSTTNAKFVNIEHTANVTPISTHALGNVSVLSVSTTAIDTTQAANIANYYTVDVSNKVDDSNVRILTESAGLRITLDRNAEATYSTNSYSLVLKHANTSAAAAISPVAFIKMEDRTAGTTANTSFIMDVFPDGAYGVSPGAAATADIAATTGTPTTAGGYLKVRVLGETRYIPLYTTI